MTGTRKFTLDFNTAITGLDPKTGTWDEKAHNKTVMPLRGLIMQIDGVSGCFIARYAVEVTYVPGVTDKMLIIEAVQAAVGEVTGKEGFFPLRGEKIPSACLPEPVKPIETWWVARVTFQTDLFVDKDEESTAEIVNGLIANLAAADGARHPGVTQRMLYVQFDRRQVSPENMMAHLEKVVAGITVLRSSTGYFPFVEPTFTYETYATSYVI